jgi:hypothetical protein
MPLGVRSSLSVPVRIWFAFWKSSTALFVSRGDWRLLRPLLGAPFIELLLQRAHRRTGAPQPEGGSFAPADRAARCLSMMDARSGAPRAIRIRVEELRLRQPAEQGLAAGRRVQVRTGGWTRKLAFFQCETEIRRFQLRALGRFTCIWLCWFCEVERRPGRKRELVRI